MYKLKLPESQLEIYITEYHSEKSETGNVICGSILQNTIAQKA
jgi:hypothetical protein